MVAYAAPYPAVYTSYYPDTDISPIWGDTLQRIGVATYYYTSDSGAQGNYWDRTLKYGGTVSLVILNPGTGPGTFIDSTYVAMIEKARASGARVLGYVSTRYAGTADVTRTTAAAMTDIDTWLAYYPDIDGIFFDEATADAGHQAYYQTVHDYVKATLPAGRQLVVINPGQAVDESYMSCCDILMSFEGTAAQYRDRANPSTVITVPAAAWERTYPAHRFWHIVHTIGSLTELDEIIALSREYRAGVVQFHDDGMPFPYGVLPDDPFWSHQVAEIAAGVGGYSDGTVTLTPHPEDPDLYSFGPTTGTPTTVPGAPTIGAVTPGPGQVVVEFTPPASNGGAAISGYTATATPGGYVDEAPSSPIVVAGLENGVSYTFTVSATNSVGMGPESASSASATPAASGAGTVTPGVSTPATWQIDFGGAPHCRVTGDTGVVAGDAQVVWVASMPDVRARTSKLETGVAAQAQDAWQAYIQDLSTGLTVADSGVVLGTDGTWIADQFTPIAGRRYKGWARVRATDGQWSPYGGTRFVAPTGVTRYFETYGLVGDGTTRSGTNYGSSIISGPLNTALAACNPGDVLKSNAPGTTITGVTVSGTTITAASGAFTGRTGQKIMIYEAGTEDGTTHAYNHKTTIASVAGGGGSATLTVAPPTNVTGGSALVNYPEFWIGKIDIDGGLGSTGGWTLDGTGCLFTSKDANYAGLRVTLPDVTITDFHFWSSSTHTRGTGLNRNTGPLFVEGSGAVGIRAIRFYAEHARDAGILFYGSAGGGPSDCHVIDSIVDHAMADPFHVTGTASGIQFIRNLSVFCGDDAIANIGYRSDGDAARPERITWESPTMRGQDWGRGLSFGGAKDCLATDVTLDGGAMASFLIGSDGDQANTQHCQLRRFTVTNPKTRIGDHPTYSQGVGPVSGVHADATIVDDACIKLLNSSSPTRQRDILIEDGTITDPGFAVQVVIYGGGEFQDGTIIIRGVTLAGTVDSGTGWRDEATYSGHLDLRGIAVPSGSTAASAPSAANS